MTTRRMLLIYSIAALVVALPFTVVHLIARPDDASITPLQHAAAAVANFFGPWGGAIVRLVDFPNAGMRSFSWVLAVGLTLLGALLVILATRTTRWPVQFALASVWTVFAIVWFAVGLGQIASGLL